MSEKQKKIDRFGPKNIMYGKRWIYFEADKKELLIHQNELDLYLIKGWKRGKLKI